MGHGTLDPVATLPNPWQVPVLTVELAGSFLGMSRAGAYRAAATGDLPVVELAGALRVPTAELYRLLALPVPARPMAPVVDHR